MLPLQLWAKHITAPPAPPRRAGSYTKNGYNLAMTANYSFSYNDQAVQFSYAVTNKGSNTVNNVVLLR